MERGEPSYSITIPTGDMEGCRKLLKDLYNIGQYQSCRIRRGDQYYHYDIKAEKVTLPSNESGDDQSESLQGQIVTLEFFGWDFLVSEQLQRQIDNLLNDYRAHENKELIKRYTGAIAHGIIGSVAVYWGLIKEIAQDEQQRTSKLAKILNLLETTFHEGFTPLMWAVICNQKDIVRQLMDNGIVRTDVVPSGLEYSALEKAFKQCRSDQSLGDVTKASDFNKLIGPRWFLFKLAIVADSPDAFRELLKPRRKESFNPLTYLEWSKLREIAEKSGSTKMVDYLDGKFKISQDAQKEFKGTAAVAFVLASIVGSVIGLAGGWLVGVVVGVVVWGTIATIGYWSSRNAAKMENLETQVGSQPTIGGHSEGAELSTTDKITDTLSRRGMAVD